MKWGLAWKISLMSLIGLPLGVSAIAFQVLKMPHSFSCQTIDQQSDASQRLYCAKARAQQKTPYELAAAIRLVNDLPPEIQPEGKQLVLQWSSELMAQAETAFQAGEFENAIDLADSIEQGSPRYNEIQQRIATWKIASQKADDIAERAIAQMAQREWPQALKTASQLKSLSRAAWVSDRYIALVQQIKADREFRDYKMAIEPPRKVAPPILESTIAKRPAPKPTAKPSTKTPPSAVVESVSVVNKVPPVKELLTPPINQDETMMKHLVEEATSPLDRTIPVFPQVPPPVKGSDRGHS
jgi:hypothetical protein